MNQSRRIAALLFVVVVVTPDSSAQTLQELREQFRQEVQVGGFGQAIAGLLDITAEQELSAGRLAIDDDEQTRILVFGVPWSTRLPIGERERLAIRLEASVGYMEATGSRDQFLEPSASGETLGYDARWTAWSALFGAGIELPITEGLTFTPIADFSISYVESEAGYRGNAVALYAPILDGILFNWRATTLGGGTGLRLVYAGRLAEKVDYEVLARYDVRTLETVHSTDVAQDFDEVTRFMTARLTFDGPVGLSLVGYPLGWTTHLGYRRFYSQTAEALGFDGFAELGGSLELEGLPWPTAVTVYASILRGHDVEGWSAGLSFSL